MKSKLCSIFECLIAFKTIIQVVNLEYQIKAKEEEQMGEALLFAEVAYELHIVCMSYFFPIERYAFYREILDSILSSFGHTRAHPFSCAGN